MVIATYRPVDAIAEQHPVVRLKHELSGKRLCSEIALDGLDGAAEALIDRRFAGHRLPPAFAARLHAHTNAHPLFLLDAPDQRVGAVVFAGGEVDDEGGSRRQGVAGLGVSHAPSVGRPAARCLNGVSPFP